MSATSQKSTHKHTKSAQSRIARRTKSPPRIPAGYIVADSLPILSLLSRHRSLEPILTEMFKILPLFFDSIERVDLRVVYDDPNSLMACVITHDTDALERLARFDEKWWLPNTDRAGNRLFVTVDHL